MLSRTLLKGSIGIYMVQLAFSWQPRLMMNLGLWRKASKYTFTSTSLEGLENSKTTRLTICMKIKSISSLTSRSIKSRSRISSKLNNKLKREVHRYWVQVVEVYWFRSWYWSGLQIYRHFWELWLFQEQSQRWKLCRNIQKIPKWFSTNYYVSLFRTFRDCSCIYQYDQSVPQQRVAMHWSRRRSEMVYDVWF